MDNKYKYLIVVFLIVVSFAAFGRILENDFINFDDNEYITENNYVKSGLNAATMQWAFTTTVSNHWHPLTMLSHALDWSLFNDHAGSHHLISLLLHIGSTLFLFLFLNRATKNLWPSAFVAALFALHPLRVESVAWAAERKDVLSMFLGMATIYAYALYVEDHKLSKYFLCLILFALGLLAKSILVTLPFVLLLLDFWPLGRWQKAVSSQAILERISAKKSLKNKDKNLRFALAAGKKRDALVQSRTQIMSSLLWEKAPFIILSVLSSIVTIWAQNKGAAIVSLEELPLFKRLSNAVISYVSYMGKTFWPSDLAVFYPYEQIFPLGQVVGSVLLLLAISLVAVFFIKKIPFLFVGWFWYLGTLIPVIGLLQVSIQPMADRYTYLPSIGLGIVFAWGIAYVFPKENIRKIILIPSAVVVIVILTILTWQQCGYWGNSRELFQQALKVTKNNYMAYTNLGVALAAEGETAEAIHNYNEAIKINANYGNAHYNLANALVKQGKIDEAINHYKQAIKIDLRNFTAHNNLGLNLVKQRKFDEAIDHFRQALQITPSNPGIYFNLGVAFADKGNLPEAIKNFRMAVDLNPDYDEARRALRMALAIERR